MARSAGGTGSAASLDASTNHFCARLRPPQKMGCLAADKWGALQRLRSIYSDAIKSRPTNG